ncbi:MAG TPA: hypothetical protein VK912_17455 [Longimicrobiales bacterium]|nr:hypothetical protein [Longimicrobiales bacterium]
MFRAAAVVSAAALVMLLTPSSSLHFVGLATLLMCPVLMAPRATLFEAVLPLDARTVFLTRISVGLALVSLPLIAWILSGHLRGVAGDPAAAFPGTGQDVRFVALPIAALAIILPHARRPGVLPLPGQSSFPALFWWVLLAIGIAGTMGLLPVGIAVVVLAGAAAGTLALTWHRMPQSYQVAPPGAEGAERTLPAAGAAARGTPGVRWWRPMLGTLFPGRVLFAILLVGFFGLTSTWFFYLIILWLPDLLGTARQRLEWMHTLPVPRTALAWATVAPAVLSLLAVALAGGVVGPVLLPDLNALHEGSPHEYSRDDAFDRRTIVPLMYWRIAPRGDAPVVRAPWGETTTTDTISLPGLTLYNPFSASTGSSPELIEWQFGRASAAVHGRTFTTSEYYADDFVAPPRVTRNARIYLLGGSLALTFMFLLAWLAELGRWHALATRRLLRYGAGAVLAAVAAGMAVLEMYGMFAHGTQLLVPFGAALATRAAAALPNMGVVALVAALPVVAAYSLLHWQIGRSDVMEAIRK